jgi:hypothetical protein
MSAARLGDALQHRLEHLYDLALPHRVSDFLFSDADLAAQLRGPGIRGAREQVLLCEDADSLSISVFLDLSVLAPLSDCDPLVALDDAALGALALMIEGVSHFVCVSWHAQHDRSCTQLELELQAEIDKFALVHALLMEQRGEVPVDLRQRLFERVVYASDLAVEEHERYRRANQFADRFCGRLQQRFHNRLDHPHARNLLRRFYRWGQSEKIGWVERA